MMSLQHADPMVAYEVTTILHGDVEAQAPEVQVRAAQDHNDAMPSESHGFQRRRILPEGFPWFAGMGKFRPPPGPPKKPEPTGP